VSQTTARSGVWGGIQRRLSAEPSASAVGDGVWGALKDRVDLAQFRPKLADDIEIKTFEMRGGNDYVMIANPRDLVHYQLQPSDLSLLRMMDGTRTVKEIVVEQFGESGEMALVDVIKLVRLLQMNNFLEGPRFRDVDSAVARALRPESTARHKTRTFFKTLSVEWKGADRLVRWMYDHLLKYFFKAPALILGAALALGGFVAFLDLVASRHFSITGRSLALGFLVLLVLNYVLTFVHETGHAVVLTHYGRKIKSAGFMIYFGSPAFFVESSDGLMLDRRQRIVQSAAGPYAESIMAGLASVTAWMFPGWIVSHTLYLFAVLNYVVLFMNLVPMLELDGYFILADIIQVPDLRPRSLRFVRHDMWHKIRHRERFAKQELGLAAYGIIGILFTIFSFYTSYFFWKEIFGGMIKRLWEGGTVTRLILVALAALVLGPVFRGLINLIRALARRLRAMARRIRFRLELKWRVEAAELIDALPMFHDLPGDVLNDLAGRVKLRTFSSGQPVFRQGDEADAFYVVRRGAVQVVDEDPVSGNQRVMTTLDRGKSFGELALATEARRSATVRAAGEVELFEIDRPTFDRLLADTIELPDFAPTLQNYTELRALPSFAHIGSDQLGELLKHGSWVTFDAGQVMMEQGQPGDAFYAIGSGQVEVIKDDETVATLGPGSYVGEIALLLDVPRTATVAAYTPVRAFRLDRTGFDHLVKDVFRRGVLQPNVSAVRTMAH
jgi:CRP-like cAMP-binding protein/Zn-dependent protease